MLSTVRLDFDPARDGFGFANGFRWTEPDLAHLARMLRALALPLAAAGPAVGAATTGGAAGLLTGAAAGLGLARLGAGDGLVRAVARRWTTFGLCGGMALTAKERWELRARAGASTPTAVLHAAGVRRLLWRQQERTLRAAAPDFLRRWLVARLGRSSPGPDVQRQWVRARAALEAGHPVLLDLVGDAPDPFAQHQVLAFGYGGSAEAGTLVVYDPNAPGEERHVHFTAFGDRARITTDIPTGPGSDGSVHVHREAGHLAGFFVIEV